MGCRLPSRRSPSGWCRCRARRGRQQTKQAARQGLQGWPGLAGWSSSCTSSRGSPSQSSGITLARPALVKHTQLRPGPRPCVVHQPDGSGSPGPLRHRAATGLRPERPRCNTPPWCDGKGHARPPTGFGVEPTPAQAHHQPDGQGAAEHRQTTAQPLLHADQAVEQRLTRKGQRGNSDSTKPALADPVGCGSQIGVPAN